MTDILSTHEVLRAEAEQIHGVDLSAANDERKLALALNKLGSTALCLSGGGIRSAAFALGLIQALASARVKDDRPPGHEDALLGQFHYLSTVSGGGYIGSWLSAWLSRDAYETVLPKLQQRAGCADGVEPSPIADLRANSNYITPRIGLLSADTWAAAAMVVRNLLLNWLLLIPVFLLSLVAIKLVALIVTVSPDGTFAHLADPASKAQFALWFALVVSAGAFSLGAQHVKAPKSPTQKAFLLRNLSPMLIAAVFFTCFIDSGASKAGDRSLFNHLLSGAVIGLAVFATSLSIVLIRVIGSLQKSERRLAGFAWHLVTDRRPLGWLLAGVYFGVCLGFWTYLLTLGSDLLSAKVALVLFAPSAFLFSQLVAETAYVAFTSAIPRSDEEREWFARSAGWYLAVIAAWIIGMGLALLGSWALQKSQDSLPWLMHYLAGSLTLSGVVGWITGKSGKTSAHGSPSRTLTGKFFGLLAPVAAVVFFGALLALGSALIDHVVVGGSILCQLGAHSDIPKSCPKADQVAAMRNLAVAFVILALIISSASLYININRFSLHGLYRNRLVRAFLGASNQKRKPDHFTDFDMADNPPMSKLWPPERVDRIAGRWKPFHVLCLTLNDVATRNLAWQQRKSMSFTVSPLHSGAGALEPVTNPKTGALTAYRGAFRASALYGGASASPLNLFIGVAPNGQNKGISLGTAMAISGAAANPNMGYHSSPLVTMLLTLLNVRLGWWLGNPGPAGKSTWRQNGPTIAIGPILTEAFGRSTDTSRCVNLSDGGHFENLGLYEMVRRRCRYIVVSDAGNDLGCAFEDLGDSIRKIAIDFGIPITFTGLDKLTSRVEDGKTARDVPYHAMATIHYAAADGDDAKPGILLYVKAGYHNDRESAGVRAYANTHPAFPHETTTDQWFSESQFESYRALGFEIMEGIITMATQGTDDHSLKGILSRLGQTTWALPTLPPTGSP
ncbi:patatin-like phospholipase family protein [Xanthobacter versatilis]|uniref:hypothetical protein n=1 Tax=Xanthobacter autotrophicus (strain ATCC BAA-1158 / Py2) TaxID=78245 RepID=UPI00372BA11F